MSENYVDESPEYWAGYSNLQHVKHELIRRYLGGWFPMLGTWAGRVLYLDTHAGRGTYLTGQLGSPLVALDTLLKHSSRTRLLKKSEFRFIFIERDQQNLETLQADLAKRTLPPRVHVTALTGDCFEHLSKLIASLTDRHGQLAPAFVFVDPYGFKVPGEVLRDLMGAGRVELFVNVMWREMHMGIGHARKGQDGWTKRFNTIFAGSEWQDIISADDPDEMADQVVDLLAARYGATWRTPIRMLDNGRTRYILMHLSNHPQGRDLMKDCAWKICLAGDFAVSKSTDPRQFLIELDPDLTPLRTWTLDQLGEGPLRWSALEDSLRPEMWLNKHLSSVVRDLRKTGVIDAECAGQFSRKSDPLLKRTLA